MKSDQELIKDFQKGNNHAFNTLVEKHWYTTIGFFIKITGNQSEAEDLAQDVFIKMYKALKKFKFGAKFKTYLYRSNVNMANSYFRSKKWKNILHLDQVADNGYEDETIEKEIDNKLIKIRSGKSTADKPSVQRTRNDEVRNVIECDAWKELETA